MPQATRIDPAVKPFKETCMRVLAFAAHPDDIAVGCGGVLHRWGQEGDTLGVIAFAENNVRRGAPEGYMLQQVMDSATVLGAKELVHFSCLPEKRLEDWFQEVYNITLSVVKDFKPDRILCHSRHDLSRDHRTVNEAIWEGVRNREFLTDIWEYAVPGSSPGDVNGAFIPNTWVSLSPENLAAKIKALECFPLQIQSPPHPRSRPGLTAHALSTGSQAYLQMAEAFDVRRRVFA